MIQQNIENDELFKPGSICLKVIKIIKKITPKAENVLNDLYDILRKFNMQIKDYNNGSIFAKHISLDELLKASKRAYIYLNSCYLPIIKKQQNDYDDDYNDNLKFNLHIDKYSNSPFTEEYIMYKLAVHEENIFYYKTNDTVFKFFYFYKTIDNQWHWSPPRKTDPEDIWMLCPKYTVESGYWKGMTIPRFIEDYVIWLDIFNPDLPYIERVEEYD